MSQNNKIYDISEIRGYIMTVTRNQLKRRIAVARGLEPGDLVIKDCHIVDVYTQTTRKGDIVVSDGVIAGVGGLMKGRPSSMRKAPMRHRASLKAISISSPVTSVLKNSAAWSYLSERRPSWPIPMKSSTSVAKGLGIHDEGR